MQIYSYTGRRKQEVFNLEKSRSQVTNSKDLIDIVWFYYWNRGPWENSTKFWEKGERIVKETVKKSVGNIRESNSYKLCVRYP